MSSSRDTWVVLCGLSVLPAYKQHHCFSHRKGVLAGILLLRETLTVRVSHGELGQWRAGCQCIPTTICLLQSTRRKNCSPAPVKRLTVLWARVGWANSLTSLAASARNRIHLCHNLSLPTTPQQTQRNLNLVAGLQ